MDIGVALQEARDRAGLSSAELAKRAGTSQPAVAKYERGRAVPSWRMLDRLLETCGYSARLRLQPRHFEIDRELDSLLGIPPGERLRRRSGVVDTIAVLASPVVVVGAAALLAHGVPVAVEALDLAVGTTAAEVEGAVTLLERVFARYTPAYYDDPLPSRVVPETITLPGRRRLRTSTGPVVLWPGHLAAVRERAGGVPVPAGMVWVAALRDIEPPVEDADLVRRYLDRLATRLQPSEPAVAAAGAVPSPDLGDLWSLGE